MDGPALLCRSCEHPVEADGGVCTYCRVPASPAAPIPLPRSGSREGGAGPDLDAVRRLAATATVPSGAALSHRGPMCPACGADLPGPVAVCGGCGERSVVLPARAGGPVGQVYRVRKALRTRQAICTHAGPDGLTVLMPDGSAGTVASTEPPAEPSVPADRLASVRSGAGLLLLYAAHGQADPKAAPWPERALVHAALAAACADRVLGRLAAVDALELGRADLVPRLGLPEPETHWLLLVDAARRGDAEDAVSHAAALPAGRYRSAVGVLAALLPDLRRVPGAGARLAPFLRSWAGREPLAGVVEHRLTGACDAQTARGDLETRLRRYPLPVPVREQILSLLAPGAGPPRRPELLGSACRAWFAWLHPGASAGLLRPDDLTPWPAPLLDRFVDSHLVGAGVLAAMPPGPARAHLRARIDPGLLGDDELDAHPGERDRRLVVAGRPVPGPRGRAASLAALRDGRFDDVVVVDLDRRERSTANLLIRAAGPDDLLAPELLGDRSLWSLIADRLAASGVRDVGDPVRAAHPEFAAWLDLRAAREHLYLAHWDRAVHSARRSLSSSALESLRDEALNVLACALHHSGEAHGAAAALQKAIEGEHSTALLSNLGVVVGGLDAQSAAPHLLRIVEEATSPVLRQRAAMRALQLWRDDPGTWDGDDGDTVLPPVLRGPLRRVALEDLPLDDFGFLMSILAVKDRDWLATPGVLDRAVHRDTLEAGFAVARASGPEYIAEFLAAIPDRDTAPDWLADHRDGFVSALIDNLVADVDDGQNGNIDICVTVATRVRGLAPRQRAVVDHLAVAMVAKRAIDERGSMPEGLLELWWAIRGRDHRDTADDEGVAQLAELATRRVVLLAAMGIQRRLNRTMSEYSDWRERFLRAGPSLYKRAVEVFTESLDTLEQLDREVRPWRTVAADPGLAEILDELGRDIGEALAPVRLMVEKTARMGHLYR